MLNAILRGKTRGPLYGGQSLIDDFVGGEDLLTASVFERLSYLPDQTLWSILSSAEIWNTPITNAVPGKLVSFRFWPKWKFKETTVEPDCFIEFKYINVIIEAKRYDNMGQQYAYQLGKELVAYWTIAPSKEPVMLLAVGGLADDTHQSIAKLRKQVVVYLKTEVSTVPDFAFAAISWARLFGIVKECLTSDHERRLIEDIREAMVLHGIAARPLVWLEDLKRQADRLGLLQQGSAQVFYARVFPKVAK